MEMMMEINRENVDGMDAADAGDKNAQKDRGDHELE
jgi:hypothetical protein